ncbi:MAG TPA: Ku protein [Polyangia bacterium]|nr:Ku protein [Polyangia bacterium]
MANALWSGRISFGLVNVPVKLFSAVQAKNVSFKQLDNKDHARIEMKRVSSVDGREIAYADIVKGYEIAPERYVVLDPEELATLSEESTRTIEIEDFVELADIDPIFYDHAYYLAPADEAAVKPYHLLLDAMQGCGKVAVAHIVLRSKEHLVAIRPMGKVLGMTTMNFADEIVPVKQLPGMPEQEPEVSDLERDVARQLVESLSREFDPGKYHDTYREAVLGLIEKKAKGKKITAKPAAAPQAAVPDLMAALQASLEKARKRDGNKASSKPPKKTKTPAGTEAKAPARRKAKASK